MNHDETSPRVSAGESIANAVDALRAERDAFKEQIAALQQELARARAMVAHQCGDIADWRRVAGDDQRALFETRRERDALKAAVERMRREIAEEMAKPYAMTNAEMEDLRDLPGDEYHERCGEVFRRYFLRVVRGTP